MEMAPTVPNTAPAQQQNTAASGVDIISQLITQANAADKRAAQATKVAQIPIAGGHQQVQSIVTPGAGHSYRQYELDNSKVTGRHQATMQGIANLSKSVANVVGQVQQQQDQKKTQELAVNIEHLMGAISSADQAKQVLAQDPNNQAAKDQLQKAQGIQAEVLNDDKNRKAIGKAFNINFTDPSKNNTPEHAALKQATDSYAKQFQDKLPTQMAPNQQAIAAAQTAQAEAKATHDLVDKIAPAIIRAQSAQSVADTRTTSAQKVAETQAEARYKSAQVMADSHYRAAIDGANIHVKGMLQGIKMRDDTLLATTQARIDQLNGKDGKTPKAQQEAQKALDSITKTLTGYQNNINLLEQNRKNANPQQVDSYNKQIQFYESQGKVLQAKQAELANRLSSAGETPVEQPASTGGAPNAPVNYIADGDDDPDDYDQ